jgi:hypothetical protein
MGATTEQLKWKEEATCSFKVKDVYAYLKSCFLELGEAQPAGCIATAATRTSKGRVSSSLLPLSLPSPQTSSPSICTDMRPFCLNAFSHSNLPVSLLLPADIPRRVGFEDTVNVRYVRSLKHSRVSDQVWLTPRQLQFTVYTNTLQCQAERWQKKYKVKMEHEVAENAACADATLEEDEPRSETIETLAEDVAVAVALGEHQYQVVDTAT